jgi:hypothetical protein
MNFPHEGAMNDGPPVEVLSLDDTFPSEEGRTNGSAVAQALQYLNIKLTIFVVQ